MKFKKLEISGFKSFRKKTTFNSRWVNRIVGPNGCGKSNIVESLRWCMGESQQKYEGIWNGRCDFFWNFK